VLKISSDLADPLGEMAMALVGNTNTQSGDDFVLFNQQKGADIREIVLPRSIRWLHQSAQKSECPRKWRFSREI